MSAPPLRELQHLFWEAITSEPGEARPSPSLLQLIPASPRLDPAARVAIYAGMYWSRILDVLRQDFACTAAVLGDALFSRLAREYLRTRPSRHPSIARVGEAFADFVAMHLPPTAPPFAADLARLEWARIGAFDASDAEPLRLSDLAGLPAEKWPELLLISVPSVIVLELGWPVHRLLDARLLDAASTEPIVAERAVVRIWRRAHHVFHASVDVTEEGALRELCRGAAFAAISAACSDAPEAAALLARWLEDEIVTIVSAPDELDRRR